MAETRKQFLEGIRQAYDKEGIARFEVKLIRGKNKHGYPTEEIIVGSSDYTCLYREFGISFEHIQNQVCNIPNVFKPEFKHNGKTYYELDEFWSRVQNWQGKWELISFDLTAGKKIKDKR